MKEFKNILVLENDLDLPRLVEMSLSNETAPIEYWFNFNNSFYHNAEQNMKRLTGIEDNTLVFASPSFVGPNNSFTGYLAMFLQLKELNKPLDVAVMYYDGFLMYLLQFLYKESNILKKENNHRMLKEVLDFHNIYETPFDQLSNFGIAKSAAQLTYNDLMQYYFEYNRKHRERVRVKSTGEELDVIYVNSNKNSPEEIDLELADLTLPEDQSKSKYYNIKEVERI